MATEDVPHYRAGIIGCGAIGSFIEDDILGLPMRFWLPQGHAPTYHASPRTSLVAGADPSPDRRAAFAERWGIGAAHVYTNYQDMLANEDLDVVSIATPSGTHANVALHTIESGVRAILLEKPVAATLADARRVIDACNQAGIVLSINHTRRGDLAYRQAKRLIDKGAIGELQTLIAHFRDGLMWIGTHAFDMLNYLNGDKKVVSVVGRLDQPHGFDPGGTAWFTYQNGVSALINGSSRQGVPFRIQAIGTSGEIVIGNHELELYRANSSEGGKEFLRHPFPLVVPAMSPMTLLMHELLDALEGGPPPVSSGETGYSALEMIMGVHISASRDSVSIRFPIEDIDYFVESL